MSQEVNRHMESIIETRLTRDKMKKDFAIIEALTKELEDEKAYSAKQEKKVDKYRTAEGSYRNQILCLSKERDDSPKEVTRLLTEVQAKQDDFDDMVAISTRLAKMARKNTKDYLVSIHTGHLDQHGFPHPIFLLEVFSDDEQHSDCEETIVGEDDPIVEDANEQPSEHPEDSPTRVDAKSREDGDEIIVTEGLSLQQQS